MARMRGTPTNGPYDWWLIAPIRPIAAGSIDRATASASRSNVNAPADRYPRGQVTGSAGAVTSPEPVWGYRDTRRGVRPSSSMLDIVDPLPPGRSLGADRFGVVVRCCAWSERDTHRLTIVGSVLRVEGGNPQ